MSAIPATHVKLLLRDGRLHAQIADADPVVIRLVRTRPRTAPDGELVALDDKKREVWLWSGLTDMDPASRAVAEVALAERYHEPVIQRLISVSSRFGVWQVQAHTTSGPRRFALRNPERSVESMPDGRVLLRDVHGNRYAITDPLQLDAHSQTELARLR